MAGQQFFDVLAMKTVGAKGPTNAVRIAADQNGILQTSVKGGPFTPVADGGFGSDTIVQMLNNVPALINALELVLSMPATAPGTEFASWTVRLAAAGVLTDVANFTFAGNATTPRFFIGDLASGRGMLRVGSTNFQITNSGAQIDFTANGASWLTRVQEQRGAGAISVNTLTLAATSNLTTVPGTPTINGIATAGYLAGYSGRLELAAGSTIVNASGAPGAGAVSILTPGAANIGPTATARVIPISYNGTNWFVDG